MATLPELIPTLVDTPSTQPQLGFDNYARGIAAAILGGKPSRFTVGLYGPWGTGKSSLLHSLANELKTLWNSNKPPKAHKDEAHELHVVNFDAWRYQHADDLILPLLASIKEQVQSSEGTASQTAKIIKSIEGLELHLFGFGMGFSRSSSDSAPAGQFTTSFSQLKEISERLLKTFMLARHICPKETGGVVDTSGDTPSTSLLKLLGMQLAWPEQYDELHRDVQQANDDPDNAASALESLESYKRFVRVAAEVIEEAPQPGDDDNEATAYSPDSFAPLGEQSFNGGRDTPASRDAESLSIYLATLLPGDTEIEPLASLMDLTEHTSAPQPSKAPTRSVMEEALEASGHQRLKNKYEKLLEYSLEAAGGSSQAVIKRHSTYSGVYLKREGSGRDPIAVSIVTKPRGKLMVYLQLTDQPEQEGFLRDVSQLGHHGVGETELTLTLDKNGSDPFGERVEETHQLIQESIDAVRERMNQ